MKVPFQCPHLEAVKDGAVVLTEAKLSVELLKELCGNQGIFKKGIQKQMLDFFMCAETKRCQLCVLSPLMAPLTHCSVFLNREKTFLCSEESELSV